MADELNILIVEDVPADADAIVEELRRANLRFRARRLCHRDEFITELERAPPDLVISDFTLPEFDALEALRLLRQTRPEIPFILVTGSRSEEVAVDCIREGADDYILKASLRRLPSSIVNALAKKRVERAQARAEAALRRSEEQYRLIAENTQDLICLLDPTGCFLYASPSFRTLGCVPEELPGTAFTDLVCPDDVAALRQTWEQALSKHTGRNRELRLRGPGAGWRVFESACSWILDEQRRPQRLVMVSRDIGQRKQAEETLRNTSRLIREAQEAERRRVARELHDSISQVLSSVRFRLEALEERLLHRDEAAWRECLKAHALLARAIAELRRISRNLRPSELDDLGLPAAVRSLVTEFSQHHPIEVQLSLAQLPDDLPPDIELSVYRIVQEALTNVARHAQASKVLLRFLHPPDALRVIIQDNGCGFLMADRSGSAHGMGLVDMQERAALLGGRLEIVTQPDSGTEVRLEVPLGRATLFNKSRREKRNRTKNQTPPGR